MVRGVVREGSGAVTSDVTLRVCDFFEFSTILSS